MTTGGEAPLDTMVEPAQRRPQRRGAAVADGVLEACIAVLADHGYDFAVEDVAERAGVHKTTVYRRWPTKAQLVAAAMDRLAASEVIVARTADPVVDITGLAVQVARSLRLPAGRRALQAVAAAGAEDADLLPVARAFLERRYAVATAILADAVAAGLVRADLDLRLVWEAMVNPLHLRAITGEPASDDVAAQLVAIVLDGCRPG